MTNAFSSYVNTVNRYLKIGLFQEKSKWGEGKNMEFPGILKNKRMWKFQGWRNKEIEFPGVIKISCEISIGLGFWPKKFQWM